MRFVIRDDDLNYFSTPQDIKQWYEDIFAQKIPVGFSVIPFVKPISDVYTQDILPEDKEYVIRQNKELVEYIKNHPLIEVLQHGCTHETKNGIFEYCKLSGLFEDTIRGKEELEKAFGQKIKVFVSPHDIISNHGVLNFGKHKEAFSYRLNNDNLQELVMGLNYAHKKQDNFIITAHIHSFNEKRKENLMRLIELAKS